MLALTLLAAVVVGGCSRERTFSAEGFIDDVEAEGVELHLGQVLVTDDESKELYALELEPLPGVSETPGEEGGHAHTGGSLAVYEDTGGADSGMQACEASADLLCYQAANVVVILEGGGIEAQRLSVAIQKLAEE